MENSNGICTKEYIEVCGWFNKNVKCIKYPCGITSSNPCVACSQGNVDYVTECKCPKSPIEDYNYNYCNESNRNSTCNEFESNGNLTVCAYYLDLNNNSTYKEKVLKCNVCANEKVLYWTETENCNGNYLKNLIISKSNNSFILFLCLIYLFY